MSDQVSQFDTLWEEIKGDVLTCADIQMLASDLEQEQAKIFFKGKRPSINITILDSTLPRASLPEVLVALRALPVIGLTVAYFPPRRHLVDFAQALRQKIANQSVLRVTYDPDLIAGAVIKYEGKIYTDVVSERV